MANPSPQAIAAIRAHVVDWTQSDQAIADAFNAPSVPNPAARPQVPIPLVEDDMAALLTDPANGSVGKLLNWPNYGLLEADIRANDHAKVARWAPRLVAIGIVTPAEAQAIVAHVNSTVPDPDWPAQVSLATAVIGGPLDRYDIAAARPGA